MIQIFCGAREPGENPVLDGMYRDRKRIFVDLLKWDLPVVGGAFEIDQFDNDHATYLIAVGDDGAHLGSFRLLPTEGPHILGTLFAWLCDVPVPRAPDIFEISRACISPRLHAAERRRIRDALISASVDYALLHHIRSYSCIADRSWLSQILALGWFTRPLGLSKPVGRGEVGALQIDISTATPLLLRETGTYVPTSMKMADAGTRVAA